MERQGGAYQRGAAMTKAAKLERLAALRRAIERIREQQMPMFLRRQAS